MLDVQRSSPLNNQFPISNVSSPIRVNSRPFAVQNSKSFGAADRVALPIEADASSPSSTSMFDVQCWMFDVHLLFSLHLRLDQQLVHPSTRDHFIVRAAFDDAALVEYQDVISVSDGGKTMRDDDAGATLHQALECFVH